MKINVDEALRGIFGEPDPEHTFKVHALNSLLTPIRGEDLPAQRKMEQFVLATRIALGGEVDMSLEDLTLLKERVGKHASPLILGRMWEILEPVA